MTQMLTTVEVCRSVMIAPYPLPKWLNGCRRLSEEVAGEVKAFFSKGNIYKESRNNPCTRVER